jgi:ribosome-binding protein aMBF1 (putative translation factor)
MIKNERQFAITKTQAEKFARALEELKGQPAGAVPPLLRKAEEDALRSQLEDLRAELTQYELLRSGQRADLHLESLDELPRALIQARIAAGLSQKDLAQRLGLKEQQIQRYEATEYASAKLGRLQQIMGALGIRLRLEGELVSQGGEKKHQANGASTG